eukprot:PhM_4_TR13944/c2_g1_i1/m.88113
MKKYLLVLLVSIIIIALLLRPASADPTPTYFPAGSFHYTQTIIQNLFDGHYRDIVDTYMLEFVRAKAQALAAAFSASSSQGCKSMDGHIAGSYDVNMNSGSISTTPPLLIAPLVVTLMDGGNVRIDSGISGEFNADIHVAAGVGICALWHCWCPVHLDVCDGTATVDFNVTASMVFTFSPNVSTGGLIIALNVNETTIATQSIGIHELPCHHFSDKSAEVARNYVDTHMASVIQMLKEKLAQAVTDAARTLPSAITGLDGAPNFYPFPDVQVFYKFTSITSATKAWMTMTFDAGVVMPFLLPPKPRVFDPNPMPNCTIPTTYDPATITPKTVNLYSALRLTTIAVRATLWAAAQRSAFVQSTDQTLFDAHLNFTAMMSQPNFNVLADNTMRILFPSAIVDTTCGSCNNKSVHLVSAKVTNVVSDAEIYSVGGVSTPGYYVHIDHFNFSQSTFNLTEPQLGFPREMMQSLAKKAIDAALPDMNRMLERKWTVFLPTELEFWLPHADLQVIFLCNNTGYMQFVSGCVNTHSVNVDPQQYCPNAKLTRTKKQVASTTETTTTTTTSIPLSLTFSIFENSPQCTFDPPTPPTTLPSRGFSVLHRVTRTYSFNPNDFTSIMCYTVPLGLDADGVLGSQMSLRISKGLLLLGEDSGTLEVRSCVNGSSWLPLPVGEKTCATPKAEVVSSTAIVASRTLLFENQFCLIPSSTSLISTSTSYSPLSSLAIVMYSYDGTAANSTIDPGNTVVYPLRFLTNNTDLVLPFFNVSIISTTTNSVEVVFFSGEKATLTLHDGSPLVPVPNFASKIALTLQTDLPICTFVDEKSNKNNKGMGRLAIILTTALVGGAILAIVVQQSISYVLWKRRRNRLFESSGLMMNRNTLPSDDLTTASEIIPTAPISLRVYRRVCRGVRRSEAAMTRSQSQVISNTVVRVARAKAWLSSCYVPAPVAECLEREHRHTQFMFFTGVFCALLSVMWKLVDPFGVIFAYQHNLPSNLDLSNARSYADQWNLVGVMTCVVCTMVCCWCGAMPLLLRRVTETGGTFVYRTLFHLGTWGSIRAVVVSAILFLMALTIVVPALFADVRTFVRWQDGGGDGDITGNSTAALNDNTSDDDDDHSSFETFGSVVLSILVVPYVIQVIMFFVSGMTVGTFVGCVARLRIHPQMYTIDEERNSRSDANQCICVLYVASVALPTFTLFMVFSIYQIVQQRAVWLLFWGLHTVLSVSTVPMLALMMRGRPCVHSRATQVGVPTVLLVLSGHLVLSILLTLSTDFVRDRAWFFLTLNGLGLALPALVVLSLRKHVSTCDNDEPHHQEHGCVRLVDRFPLLKSSFISWVIQVPELRDVPRYGRRMWWRRLVLMVCIICMCISTKHHFEESHVDHRKEQFIEFVRGHGIEVPSSGNLTLLNDGLTSFHEAEVEQIFLELPSCALVGLAFLVDALFPSRTALRFSKLFSFASLVLSSFAVLSLTTRNYVTESHLYRYLPHCAPIFDDHVLWVVRTLTSLVFAGLVLTKILPLMMILPPTIVRILSLIRGDAAFSQEHSRTLLFFTGLITPVLVCLPLVVLRQLMIDDVVTAISLVITLCPPLFGAVSIAFPTWHFDVGLFGWLASYTGAWLFLFGYLCTKNGQLWELVQPELMSVDFYLDLGSELALTSVVLTDFVQSVLVYGDDVGEDVKKEENEESENQNDNENEESEEENSITED